MSRDLHNVHAAIALYVLLISDSARKLNAMLVLHHPAAAVGTVQVRSLIEPIRKIIARLRGHFIEGKAVDLCMSERLVEVEAFSATGESQHIYVPCVAALSMLFRVHICSTGMTSLSSPSVPLRRPMVFLGFGTRSNSRPLAMRKPFVGESWVTA
jgi:hypothetical protein